jgi:hypothetical protein
MAGQPVSDEASAFTNVTEDKSADKPSIENEKPH